MNRDPGTLEIVEYNAFTSEPFAGNPAGVVIDASDLDERLMQLIARQLNLSETAYLVPATDPDADVRIRWFTPTREVSLCGHATIAAFTAAAERGVFPVSEGAERSLQVETPVGRLRVRIVRGDGKHTVYMQLPVPRFESLSVDREDFAARWSVEPDDLSGNWARTQLDYWFVPVKGLAVLRSLELNARRLAEVDREACYAFYSTETVDPGSHWHLRFFAPFHGVPEDPVTGSAQGPMGALYQMDSDHDGREGWFEFRGEQGDHLERPGRVTVRVERRGDSIADLEIGGTAVSVLEGRIRS